MQNALLSNRRTFAILDNTNKTISVVYAEDDPDDQLTFAEIIAIAPFPIAPHYFTNGLSLYQFLQDGLSIGKCPDIVVLDINMPIWDGIKTLQAIRADHRLTSLPIIIFTTSRSDREKERCLQLGANAFIPKPDNHIDYRELIDELVNLVH